MLFVRRLFGFSPFLSLIGLFGFYCFAGASTQEVLLPQYLPYEAEWCLPLGDCLALEVADTEVEQRLGLMKRPLLPMNKGMLFLFKTSRLVSFWMHQTIAPLDIIFCSKFVLFFL